jgi:hypothetical protein
MVSTEKPRTRGRPPIEVGYEEFFEAVAEGMKERDLTSINPTEQTLSLLSGYSTWIAKRMRAEAALRKEPISGPMTLDEVLKRAGLGNKEKKKGKAKAPASQGPQSPEREDRTSRSPSQ